jgi:hypothetical protein
VQLQLDLVRLLIQWMMWPKLSESDIILRNYVKELMWVTIKHNRLGNFWQEIQRDDDPRMQVEQKSGIHLFISDTLKTYECILYFAQLGKSWLSHFLKLGTFKEMICLPLRCQFAVFAVFAVFLDLLYVFLLLSAKYWIVNMHTFL